MKYPILIVQHGTHFEIVDANGTIVAVGGSHSGWLTPSMNLRDAHRIVACLNACAGIDTQTLIDDGESALTTASKLKLTEAKIESLQTQLSDLTEENKKLAADKKVHEWIKCSERMPDVGEIVLTSHDGCMGFGESQRSGANYQYFTSVITGRELLTTHWTNLPEPPSDN